jgi:hypothetical protein
VALRSPIPPCMTEQAVCRAASGTPDGRRGASPPGQCRVRAWRMGARTCIARQGNCRTQTDSGGRDRAASPSSPPRANPARLVPE